MSDACAMSSSGFDFKITRSANLPGAMAPIFGPVVAAECPGGVGGRALENLHRSQAGFLHQLELTKKRGAVDGADVPGISPGCDGDAGVLERLQVLERDIVGLLDAIEDRIGIRERGLDALGHFVGGNSCDVERRDHFRVAPRFFFRREIQLVRERAAVAFENDERGRQDRAAFLSRAGRTLIHEFVVHAVNEKIGAFFDRGARRLQLGRVHGDANLARVAFFDDGMNDGPEFLDRVLGVRRCTKS